MADNMFMQTMAPRVDSNYFDGLANNRLWTGRMGELTPTNVRECYPGDVWTISVENLVRFLPLVSPFMTKVKVKTYAFFSPKRVLMNLGVWEELISGKVDAEMPFFVTASDGELYPLVGSLADYLGVCPPQIPNDNFEYDAFPMAAYAATWDRFFRDQNLQSEIFSTPLVPGLNDIALMDACNIFRPYRKAWRHDLYTSALPTAQAGNAVTLPLTNTAAVPVSVVGQFPTVPGNIRNAITGNSVVGGDNSLRVEDSGNLFAQDGADAPNVFYDPQGTLEVELNAEAVAINDLRTAIATQYFLELMLRGGRRYKELIQAHFSTNIGDASLWQPEYVYGSTATVSISELLQSAQTTDPDEQIIPLGQYAGNAISASRTESVKYHCKEHGILMIMVCIIPDSGYMQGQSREWARKTWLDYMWPSFAHLGERAMKRREVWAYDPTYADGDTTFGYIPPNTELMTATDSVAGLMRTTYKYWHLYREFASAPLLNGEFITCNPSRRIFADTSDSDNLIVHTYHHLAAVRKLPKYNIPSPMGMLSGY